MIDNMANYNSRKKENNPMYGKKHSDSAKQRISNKLKARWEACNSSLKPTLNNMVSEIVKEYVDARFENIIQEIKQYHISKASIISEIKNQFDTDGNIVIEAEGTNYVLTEEELSKQIANSLQAELGDGKIMNLHGKSFLVKILDSNDE